MSKAKLASVLSCCFLISCLVILTHCSGKKTQLDDTVETTRTIQGNRSTVKNTGTSTSAEVLIDFSNGMYYPIKPPLIEILDIEASSERSASAETYSGKNLIDQTWRSWAEGSMGNGTGEFFTIIIDEKTIAGFALKNGYGNLDYYSKNNRVKSFTVYFDEKSPVTIPIKDSFSFEQYVFEKPVTCKTLRFVIGDVYPGTEYNDTCISEIALLDQKIDDEDFYENVLFWFSSEESKMDTWDEDTQFAGHQQQMSSISDADKILLMDYLPFNTELTPKTKIAILDSQSVLKLKSNLPRLDGATAMYPLYSSFVHAVYPEIKVTVNENYDWWRGSHPSLSGWTYFPRNLNSIVQCNTTSKAYQRLIDGETDIVICYEPSEAEKNAAAAKGKHFSLTPIAKDAFVFMVNEKNILENISQQQIRDIYSGRVTNWKIINGLDEPVIAYQRPENSGSQTILQSIMGGDKLKRPILDGEFIPSGMMTMIRSVASDYYNYNSAIGYSFLFYLTSMAGDSGTRILAIDGIKPTRQTIQNNAYPFIQTVYAVTTVNESENTKKLIDWMISSQGQELVEKTGYIPVK